MKTVLEIIWNGLETRNVTVLLIGGHALLALGVARQTLDIDCLMVDSDSGAIHTILTEAGYRETERTENFVRYSHSSIYLMDVDVMLVDRGTFDKMLQRSSVYQVGAINVRIPCLVHLIALKLHAIRNNPKRELKDLGDIVELLRSNQGEVTREELKSTCARYGPEGIYTKLESYL
ncbi:MAG: nucleotidyltransferase family protein [Candidatus Omnitrophica bacterium]|nr:nucleotidyltransferase family protein [Candidatus Omnitrophota bacterium]